MSGKQFLSWETTSRKNFLANASELRNFRKVYKNSVKITRHSEDNDILGPKNLLKESQEDLSLNAQDDENVEMFEPSPAVLKLISIR